MQDDDRHDRYARLVEAIDPSARLLRYWSLTGGVSAQTTALEVEQSDGSRRRLVIRAHGQRDLARDPDIAEHEFQLLAALRAAGLPVPGPVYVHQAGEIFDRSAVVVEFIDGEIITDPAQPARYIAEIACWLARIHEFDLDSADLNFLVAIDYQSSNRFEPRPDDSPLAGEICATLREFGPVNLTNSPVLMHGDFWRGNMLWKNGVLAAIIDWEDAMIGDPVIDLARTRLEVHVEHGEMARERFTSHYLSYRDIDVDSLAFWDLTMSLGFIRAVPGWGLSEDREREILDAMSAFAGQARRQLRVDRS